jgi:hypothetical protein
MVIDVYFDVIPVDQLGELADAALLARVHENEPPDPVQLDLFHFGEIEQVRCGMKKKIPKIFFLRSRKYETGAGVEFARTDQGRQRVKIGIDMGCDDVRGRGIRLLFGGCFLTGSCRHLWNHSAD